MTATYQRAMTAIFHDRLHGIEDYVDHIVVKSKEVDHHIANAGKVFT